MLKKNIANCFTVLRIICSITMIFLETPTIKFLVIYTVAGLSDVLDGYLARKLEIESDFGRKLDSAADVMMYGIMLVKIFGYLEERLPEWNILCIWLTVAARIINYLFVFIRYHEFPAVHTFLNRLTGAVLFVLPYLINSRVITVCSVSVCILAPAAAFHELYLNISDYDFKY